VKRPVLGDGWYDSEEPTRTALVTELQRIRRRTAIRPIPVLVLAAVITGAVTYKIATKPRIYEADVVLALTEGQAETSRRMIPFDQLKAYVSHVLMPDTKLIALIEKRNLHRLRKRFGNEYALTELREQVEVEIWRNTFLTWEEGESEVQKSARIGLTVTDGDPDRAFDIAHDLASIVIETHEEQRQKIADDLAREVKQVREHLSTRLTEVDGLISMKLNDAATAERSGKTGIVSALQVDISALSAERKRLEAQVLAIAQSPEAFADETTRAGLDTTFAVVEERKPERQEQSAFVLIMVIVVVGTGALLGSAVLLGAFDARVHDTDDVTRLGLPVLGHVPGFPGDHVGSLGARGAVRARVPSFLRWRSHR
jgi:hypothetical protein